MAFELPNLPYAFDAIEPHIDEKTMRVHYGKHHQGYVNNLNEASSGTPLNNDSIEAILKHVSQHGEAVRNNGGGHYNHSFFWTILSPQGGGHLAVNWPRLLISTLGTLSGSKRSLRRQQLRDSALDGHGCL